MTIAIVISDIKSGSANTTTSNSLNTTGVNLIVVCASSIATETCTDSKSNTWTPLTEKNGSSYFSRLFYCASPTVGSGHTFTVTSSSGFAFIGVLAISGAAASPFDQESGATSSGTTSLQPGSITPSQANCILVTAVTGRSANVPSIDGGFTLAQQLASGAEALGLAYLIQTTAAAANPHWTSAGGISAITMASFKAAAAAVTIQQLAALGVG